MYRPTQGGVTERYPPSAHLLCTTRKSDSTLPERNVAVAQHKEIVIALFGISAGLTGLGLAFLRPIPSMTRRQRRQIRPFLNVYIGAILTALVAGLLCCLSCFAWLCQNQDNRLLYQLATLLFITEVVFIGLSALWALRLLLWGETGLLQRRNR